MKPSQTLVPALTPLFRHVQPSAATAAALSASLARDTPSSAIHNNLNGFAVSSSSSSSSSSNSHHVGTLHAVESGWGRWWISNARDGGVGTSTTASQQQPATITTSPLLQHTLTYTPSNANTNTHTPSSDTTSRSSISPSPSAYNVSQSSSTSASSPRSKSHNKSSTKGNTDSESDSQVPAPTIAWFDHLSMV